MVCHTPSSKDAFTHQIWNSHHKEYRRYAPDSKNFLETRSEVKFKVTVDQLWYATLCQSKMHPHSNFEIPTSNNVGGAEDTIILKNRSGQGLGHSDPKMVRDTPPSQDASKQQIWKSYLKKCRRYAPDTKRNGQTD